MRKPNGIFISLICLFLTVACAKHSGSESQASYKGGKASRSGSSSGSNSAGTLNDVYKAEIFLDLNEKRYALDSVQKARKNIDGFAKKAANQSDLLVELSYITNGLVTKLYIPSERGESRFDEAKKAISKLSKSDIHPNKYRLVRFNSNIDMARAKAAFDETIKNLEDTGNVNNAKVATARAERELGKFIWLLNISVYDGLAKNRLEFHTKAAEVFLENRAYDIADDAVSLAEKALSEVRLENTDKPLVAKYEMRLKHIDQSIQQKDPSLLKKLMNKIL